MCRQALGNRREAIDRILALPLLIFLIHLSNPAEASDLCKSGRGVEQAMADLTQVPDELKAIASAAARAAGKKFIYVFDGEISCGGYHVPFRSFGWDFTNRCGMEETVSNKHGWYRFRALSEYEFQQEACRVECPWQHKNQTECRVTPRTPYVVD